MDRELTDMHRMADEYAPAAMPESMRARLLAAMIREEAELQADTELELELAERYSATAMPASLQLKLEEGMRPAQVYHRRWRYGVAAAILVLLLVLPLVWWGQRGGAGVATAPVVEMRRELLPAGDAEGATRCDTFVMHGEDHSRLLIKVRERVDYQLSDEVI